MIVAKSAREIEIMRQVGHIAAQALELVVSEVKPGVTTGHLDELAEEFIRSQGAVPAFKGYRGFPATICASLNEGVVHGIPGGRRLEGGDLLSIDVGVLRHDYYGDVATTVPVGQVRPEADSLLDAGRKCLEAAVGECRVGNHLSDVSHAIQKSAESAGYSVVREFVGHGIGRAMHEDPQVPNFGPPGRGPRLSEGMTLALEPMVNQGGHEVDILEDGWAVVTRDRALSVHFEHTVAVTGQGPDVLTI